MQAEAGLVSGQVARKRGKKRVVALFLALGAGAYFAYQHVSDKAPAPQPLRAPDEGALAVVGDGATVDIDGLPYPTSLQLPGQKTPQLLTGGGTRYKFNLVKVYAVGLYITEEAVKEAPLKAFLGTSADQLGPGFGAAMAVLPRTQPATLVLQFHRSVDVATLASAIKDSLASRLSADALETFHTTLAGALAESGVPAGLELTFACSPGEIAIGAGSTKDMVELKDPDVCPALFDLYYGPDPISPQVKDGMAAGFVQLVSSLF